MLKQKALNKQNFNSLSWKMSLNQASFLTASALYCVDERRNFFPCFGYNFGLSL